MFYIMEKKLFAFTEFDLEKERSVLDEQGLRIAENQENSQKNRRKLAENTRGIILLVPFFISLLINNIGNAYIGLGL